MDDSVKAHNWQLTCTFSHSQLLPNPLDGNYAPAPDTHLRDSTSLIRSDLTELRSNKEHTSPYMQHALSTSTDVSLFEHNSVNQLGSRQLNHGNARLEQVHRSHQVD
ncbi:predicted protein [Lichtheimia corymbifera JMRC:FSU:9682]|uniref:Uncharacterized protein n=1 Tax=Lichtheimia corymbifera JMRC:FSU:9682 TaxID=1263082 RepID=A0A068S4Z5_9FUNG|nr:predicted protein [Lichtheimia corymbifera JMRC:FSU:9682]